MPLNKTILKIVFKMYAHLYACIKVLALPVNCITHDLKCIKLLGKKTTDLKKSGNKITFILNPIPASNEGQKRQNTVQVTTITISLLVIQSSCIIKITCSFTLKNLTEHTNRNISFYYC